MGPARALAGGPAAGAAIREGAPELRRLLEAAGTSPSTTAPGERVPGAVAVCGKVQSVTTAFSTSTLAADRAGPTAASTPATAATAR